MGRARSWILDRLGWVNVDVTQATAFVTCLLLIILAGRVFSGTEIFPFGQGHLIRAVERPTFTVRAQKEDDLEFPARLVEVPRGIPVEVEFYPVDQDFDMVGHDLDAEGFVVLREDVPIHEDKALESCRLEGLSIDALL